VNGTKHAWNNHSTPVTDESDGKKYRRSWCNARIMLVQAVTAIDTVSDFPLTPYPLFRLLQVKKLQEK
jgi:hypothetical protein